LSVCRLIENSSAQLHLAQMMLPCILHEFAAISISILNSFELHISSAFAIVISRICGVVSAGGGRGLGWPAGETEETKH
jgi:hypothetical protein